MYSTHIHVCDRVCVCAFALLLLEAAAERHTTINEQDINNFPQL